LETWSSFSGTTEPPRPPQLNTLSLHHLARQGPIEVRCPGFSRSETKGWKTLSPRQWLPINPQTSKSEEHHNRKAERDVMHYGTALKADKRKASDAVDRVSAGFKAS
jgi:hypothetical protein